MIFAAGLGTRLKPLTDHKPKALVEIGGKTFLEQTVEKLKNAGFTDIVVNVHHFAEQIIRYLEEKNNFGITIRVSDESGQLLDTGGGLLFAKPFLKGDEPILIHNVDVLSDTDLNKLVEYHKKEKALATLVVRQRKTQRYFLFDETNRLVGWKNIQTGEEKIAVPEKAEGARLLTFSGIHVVSPEIFKYITQKGKFSIIDMYLSLAQNHRIAGYEDNTGLWMDIGKPAQLKEAQNMINK